MEEQITKLENKTAYNRQQRRTGRFIIVNVLNGKFIKVTNRVISDVDEPENASRWKGQDNIEKVIDAIMEFEPRMRIEFRLFENGRVL